MIGDVDTALGRGRPGQYRLCATAGQGGTLNFPQEIAGASKAALQRDLDGGGLDGLERVNLAEDCVLRANVGG